MALSPTINRILLCLADGTWHSGEELGATLGISRAAVSKNIKSLLDLGLRVESRKGVGYRTAPLELLDQHAIAEHLTRFHALPIDKLLASIDVLPSLVSTNQYLLDLKMQGESIHRRACLAELQTQGRGRRGRKWVSPFAKNIYFSLGWHFEGGIAAISGLSLAIGVTICRSLKKLGFHSATLKWPNDILVDQHKVGGVLIELSGDAVSDCVAVIGIGMNVDMTHSDEISDQGQSDIDQPWTSLKTVGYAHGRNVLVAAMLSELVPVLERYPLEGFHPFVSEWNDYSAFHDSEVSVVERDEVQAGIMRGVDERGQLKVEIDGRLTQFASGEVSLRAAP